MAMVATDPHVAKCLAELSAEFELQAMRLEAEHRAATVPSAFGSFI
jgi:hypothetical protein